VLDAWSIASTHQYGVNVGILDPTETNLVLENWEKANIWGPVPMQRPLAPSPLAPPYKYDVVSFVAVHRRLTIALR